MNDLRDTFYCEGGKRVSIDALTNFLYACSLYNVWRLVDLLVKLVLVEESEREYKPLVTADLFLTIAKKHDIVGLDRPPD